MDDKTIQELRDAGVDVDGANERFMGNMGMLERFLKKFPDDPNYEALVAALEAKDIDTAFASAHTMKGVCGNLALTSLYSLVSEVTEHLRSKDLEGAVKKMPEVTEEYEKMLALIGRL
jgi:HPt (histidine-containing phosphotransfer) domain-containing protein